MKNLYVGAAGVIHALDVFRRRGLAETAIDLAAAARRTLAAFREEPDFIPVARPDIQFISGTGITITAGCAGLPIGGLCGDHFADIGRVDCAERGVFQRTGRTTRFVTGDGLRQFVGGDIPDFCAGYRGGQRHFKRHINRLATTLLFLPLLDFSNGLPPYLVRVDWANIALVYGLFSLVLLFVTLITTVLMSRERLSTVVKLGDA